MCDLVATAAPRLSGTRQARSQRRVCNLQAALPACDVEVLLQTSKGGRTIVAAARFDTRILKYRPHIVITDLTVCDLRGVSSSLDAYRLQAGWETLLRKLLSVPPSVSDTAGAEMAAQGSPAILHLESWDRFPMGGCRNTSGRIHHEVSVFYRVPARTHARNALARRAPPTAPEAHPPALGYCPLESPQPQGSALTAWLPKSGRERSRAAAGVTDRAASAPPRRSSPSYICMCMYTHMYIHIIQVVSFMLGVCAHDPATAPARHWPAGCSDGK